MVVEEKTQRRHSSSSSSTSSSVTPSTASITDATTSLDEDGCPRVPYPPTNDGSLLSFVTKSAMMFFTHAVMTPIILIVLLGWGIKNKFRMKDTIVQLYRTVNEADHRYNSDTDFQKRCRDPALLSKLWKLPSAKRYLMSDGSGDGDDDDGDSLEYQLREGYCSLATLRCVLRSFRGCVRGGSSSSLSFVEAVSAATPKQTDQGGGKPSDPAKWQKQIDEIVAKAEKCQRKRESHDENETKPSAVANGCRCRIQTDVVRGDVSYEEFLRVIREGLMDGNDTDINNNDSSTTTKISSRVAINYLRPALFGFKRPKWIPFHFIVGLFGGHFSPVIGVLDNDDDKDNPLVGIFDVNHTYGGAYLVPAKLLYKSVNAVDIATETSRAAIVVTLVEEEENEDEKTLMTSTTKRKEE